MSAMVAGEVAAGALTMSSTTLLSACRHTPPGKRGMSEAPGEWQRKRALPAEDPLTEPPLAKGFSASPYHPP